jgi:hypothetical protein
VEGKEVMTVASVPYGIARQGEIHKLEERRGRV